MGIDSTIETFRQHIDSKNGLFMPQRFHVKIAKPSGASIARHKEIHSATVDDLLFSCASASIPGRTLSTGSVLAPGPEQKYPYQDTFDDLECTFHCTNNSQNKSETGYFFGLPEKRFFDAWMASVCDAHTMVMNYSEEYSREMTIVVYDGGNNQLGSYLFHRCYPIAVGEIELSQQSEEPATFPVTFSYDRWKYKDSLKNA